MTIRNRRSGTPTFRQSNVARGAWGLPLSHVPGGSHMGASMGPRFHSRARSLDLSGGGRPRRGVSGKLVAASALLVGLVAFAA